jgi:MinD superfamily P-loop ATPase
MLKWLPVVEPSLCDGCSACVEACSPQCLEVVGGVAVLMAPDLCGSEEHCIEPCPTTAIRMEWVKAKGNMQVGRWL